MTFETQQGLTGRWRWILKRGDACVGLSAQTFSTELDCLVEIETVRLEIGAGSFFAGASADQEAMTAR